MAVFRQRRGALQEWQTVVVGGPSTANDTAQGLHQGEERHCAQVGGQDCVELNEILENISTPQEEERRQSI